MTEEPNKEPNKGSKKALNLDPISQLNDGQKNTLYVLLLVLCGLGLNLLLPRLMGSLGLPLYLDSIGTLSVAAMGGYVPGVITAFATNGLNTIFDHEAIYYAILSILMAVAIIYFIQRGKLNRAGGVIQLILLLTFIGGFLGSLITLALSGPSDDPFYVNARGFFIDHLGANVFVAHVIVCTLVDLVDKTITVLVTLLIMRLIPENIRKLMFFNGWRQTPLSSREMKEMLRAKYRGISLRMKISLLITIACLTIAVALTVVNFQLFSETSRTEYLNTAKGTAKLAADVIDPEKVDRYIAEGEKVPGYKETKDLLTAIRDSSDKVQYVYAYKIMKDGCHVVFDLDTEELKGSEPGEIVDFDPSFEEELPKLLAGKRIKPVESNDTYGWLLSVYEPVYDSKGNCVCYAAADVSMHEIVNYNRWFFLRSLLIFLAFFVLVFTIALQVAKYHIVVPINSMASSATAFATGDDDEEKMDEGMEKIRDLRINTGDEVENLYLSLCSMCSDLIDHMKSIRRQSETISEMQNGLILVMADMVESRDADTGNHIHKTAAYTRIIMEGLKRKGYYADQLTDRYISDVEHSAPLHDVGKINVSDTVLNKPGKLTDEEYEIMKTHTTAGRNILEQAVSKVRGESYLTEAINMAAYHHEKWNGTGYPEGLAGEDIPLSARIMAVADVFDALASPRVYKKAMPFEKAVSIIREDSGTHFDPKCVEAFLDSLDEVRDVHERLSGTGLENL